MSAKVPSEGSTDDAISSPSKFSSTLYSGALSPNQVNSPEIQIPLPFPSPVAAAVITTKL